MVIFHCYVSSPEGFSRNISITSPFSTKSPWKTSRELGKPMEFSTSHGGRGSQHHLNEVVAARLGRRLIVARPRGVREAVEMSVERGQLKIFGMDKNWYTLDGRKHIYIYITIGKREIYIYYIIFIFIFCLLGKRAETLSTRDENSITMVDVN